MNSQPRLLLPLIAALACSSGDDDARSLRDGLAGLPRDSATPAAEEAPPESESLPDTVGWMMPVDSVPPAADTVAPPLQPGEPMDVRPSIPLDPPQIPPSREWTAGVRARGGGAMATLRGVRAGRNEGFDRVVFLFEGETVPGYRVEYVDRPVRQCGSGRTVRVEGDGWLQVRMEPARAHTERGEPSVAGGPGRRRPDNTPLVEELVQTCDFEGQVEWVIGTASPNPYRVLELRAPARLVIDIRHDG